MKRSVRLVILAATSSLLVPGVASAQTAFGLDRFQPSARGSEWFSADSLDLRGHLRLAVGVVGDWAYQPLVISDASGSVRSAVVKDQFFVHAGASLVLWDRLRVDADVPVMAFADGTTATIGTQSFAKPSSAGAMGDLRLGADVRLLGTYGDPFTAAVGADLSLPTGSQGAYAGDGTVRVSPHVLVAGDVGPFVYASRIGSTIRGLEETYGGGAIGTDLTLSLAAGVRLWGRRLVVGPEVFGASTVTGGGFFSKQATPLEGLLGAHCLVSDSWRVGAGVGTGLTAGLGTPTARGLLSIEWVPRAAPPDRDGDGISDAEDACPEVPGVRTDDPKTNGCPADRDHDGVLDAGDACPDVSGVRSDDPKANGCPEVRDRDHDGISDADDACPEVPGVRTDDPKTSGCPADRDHDGVLDADDACVDVPGVHTDDPKTNGCPEDRDRDKDGIPNDVDACPDVPGKADPDPKRNGCPAAFVKDGEIKILDQVKFRTASAEIVSGVESEGVLVAVAGVLAEHPEIKLVRVEGHTDDRGNERANEKLSADRAAAVVKWLEKHKVEAARLKSAGLGQSRPIDSNATEAGRQNNRRVEFHIEGR